MKNESMLALMSGIQYLIDQSIAKAPFDKIKNGIIVAKNLDKTYQVLVDDKVYNFPSLSAEELSANAIVKIVIPQNEYSGGFILNTGKSSGGGEGSVTSVGIQNAIDGGLIVSGSPITSSGIISIGHANVLGTPITTQALYPITFDTNGHITGYGLPAEIPTLLSQLTNDSGFITDSYHDNTKVDKITGKGLSTNDYTNADKNKLDALPTNPITQETDPTVPSYVKAITQSDIDSWDSKADASDVNNIEALIPEQATSSNQLADKAFVNSTVGTNTAIFRGTYNTLAELQAQTATNNDYGFVVSADSAGNTIYNRYKYNGSSWVFEYALNNSSFTAQQWASIQSGITDNLVTKLNGIENGAEVNVIDEIKVNGTVQTVTNKTVDIDVPTLISDLTNDSGFITSSYHDNTKQDTLISGTNIKTINNTSILGSGNIDIQGGGTSNVAIFTISSTSDLTTAQNIVNAVDDEKIVFVFDDSETEPFAYQFYRIHNGTGYDQYEFYTIRARTTSYSSYSRIRNAVIYIRVVDGVVTLITKTDVDVSNYYLSCTQDYSTPYTPEYDGSPTTKKYVDDGLAEKQETLISGTNIKTINNQSLLGAGNINIQGGGGSTDYNDLSNKPSINGLTLIGDIDIHPDWNQNNPFASDYIKNRTHYIQTAPGVAIYQMEWENSGQTTTSGLTYNEATILLYDNEMYQKLLNNVGQTIGIQLGNNEPFDVVLSLNGDTLVAGDTENEFYNTESGIGFIFSLSKNNNYPLHIGVYEQVYYEQILTITINYMNTIFHPLDERFIPTSISSKINTNTNRIANLTDNVIPSIQNKIPAQASSSNQLADKAFVNSTVGTNTAIFRGTYNTLAELQAQTATNNDYGFVITTDSAGNTLYNRYKYNGSSWVFEYSLNNSSFTAQQWASIQSGITQALVDLISTNQSNIATILTDYIKSTDLSAVATSGSYNDLSNRPSIPSITYSTTDIGEDATLASGEFYFVYEE